MKLYCVECDKYLVDESNKYCSYYLICKNCYNKYLEKKRKEYFKKYYEANREKILEHNAQYKKEQYNNNPRYRFIQNTRSLISISISKRNNLSMVKQKHTEEILGCSLDSFIKYIENLFTDGMTWDNYGYGANKWNIDHIKPISLAQTEEEVYALNHYTNLQPMWQIDNFRKHNNFN